MRENRLHQRVEEKGDTCTLSIELLRPSGTIPTAAVLQESQTRGLRAVEYTVCSSQRLISISKNLSVNLICVGFPIFCFKSCLCCRNSINVHVRYISEPPLHVGLHCTIFVCLTHICHLVIIIIINSMPGRKYIAISSCPIQFFYRLKSPYGILLIDTHPSFHLRFSRSRRPPRPLLLQLVGTI